MTARSPLAPRAGYESLRTYSPGMDAECAIDLGDNTNLWGASPAAARALGAAIGAGVTRYPSRYGASLKRAIAERYDVAPDMVVTGAGSDGVLEPAIRAFCAPGDRVAMCDPTFVMAGTFALMNGAVPVAVPLLRDYDADADGLLATGARIIYLCSPNNPTGRALSAEVIARIATHADGLVIIDEAYAEFAGADAMQLARESDRVLVTRTLSKAYGLAGLRVGYGIAAAPIVAALEKARGPYTIAAPSEAAAEAAMRDDEAWVRQRVLDALASRSRLDAGLRELGLVPAPSDANFLFVPTADARRLADGLAQRGIAVRAFAGLRQVNDALAASDGNALRITVGPWELMQRVLDALSALLAGDACR